MVVVEVSVVLTALLDDGPTAAACTIGCTWSLPAHLLHRPTHPTAVAGWARPVLTLQGALRMSEMEIRTFTERDRAELMELFGRAGQGAPSASLWGHERFEAAVYLTPYMDIEPDSLFVAVVDGALAGYLTGCLGRSAFPSESERIDRAIREYRLILRPGPAALFVRSMLDLTSAAVRRKPTAAELGDPRWPAHPHINVIPEVRGTGVGATLMNRWLDRLIEAGVPGCYLQTLVENTRAVRFFERMGFEKYGPAPLVPGSRDRGRRLHQQTMVWSPQPS